MSDKERAKKLAAAKKKLKEYQSKEKHNTDIDSSDASEYGGNTNVVTVENANAKQQYQHHEENTNKNEQQQLQYPQPHQQQQQDITSITPQSQQSINSISDYFNNLSNIQSIDINAEPLSSLDDIPYNQNSTIKPPTPPTTSLCEKSSSQNNHQVNTIEILISEKTALTSELTKQQALCKEKMFECEELLVQLQITKNRNKLLENEINDLHLQNSNLNENFNDLKKKYEQKKYDYDIQNKKIQELQEHFDEIKRELINETLKTQNLEKELKDKKCELELCQIRINQISDETNLVSDNRVEALTQTKFMYEQQICDLQSMVQQLTTERDQANQQYQNYVQHLNKEMTTITEKNSELNTENERLSNRERQLIEHIGNLEKQIQENIAKQEILKEKINEQSSNEISTTTNNSDENLQLLKEKIENLNLEKIQLENEKKLQDEKLQDNYKKLLEKDNIIYELEEKLEKIISEKPNHNKLLATIESDKIAASRALIQNEELKKQLDEIQQKLIQITNDKVDLIQQLDTEKYKNRKINENYNEMEKQLKDTTEKLHFKDEEMIRLTHEHNELNKTILQLNQRIDRLMHYEAKEYIRQRQEKHEIELEATENVEEQKNNDNLINTNGNSELMEKNHHDHDHDHRTDHHHHHHDHHDHHDHDHDHKQDEIQNQRKVDAIETDSKIQSELDIHKKMPSEKNSSNNEKSTRYSEKKCDDNYNNKLINGIEKHEAMEKLQERFRKIMLENADLSDEKQRLEHLVCQLQYETETIGEYITLYQTQRRLLKQREIEKQTQLHILLNEREEMKDKLKNLIQLFDNLCEIYIKNDINNDISINKIIISSENIDKKQLLSNDEILAKSTTLQTKNNDNYNFNNENLINNKNQSEILINSNNNENIISNNTESIIKDNFDLQNFNDIDNYKKLQKQQIIKNNPILMKIQNIITEIKDKEENLEANLKLIPSVDHCACCQGKYETI